MLRAKGKNQWVLLYDNGDEESQLTEVLEVPGGCVMRCTDSPQDEDTADAVSLVFLPGVKLGDLTRGKTEKVDDDGDVEDDDDE